MYVDVPCTHQILPKFSFLKNLVDADVEGKERRVGRWARDMTQTFYFSPP